MRRMPFALALCLFASFFPACSCDDRPETRKAGPQIEVRLLGESDRYDEGSTLADGATIDFGVVKVGSTHQRTLALRNFGDADLQIQPPVLDQGASFQITASLQPCTDSDDPGKLTFGGCVLVTVELHPQALGDHADVLRIRSDDGERPEVSVRLSGRAALGGLKACVASVVGSDQNQPLDQCSSAEDKELVVDYGSVPIGGGALTRAMRLENPGEVSLAISSVAASPGDPVDFSVEPPNYSTVLEPKQSAMVQLVFKPAEVGDRAGTIRVSADDPSTAPVLVQVKARGDATRLCLQPSTLDFGNVDIGSTTPPKEVLLRNCGTRDIDLGEVVLERDPDFSIVQMPAATHLAPGVGAAVRIVLRPTSLGPKIGRLKVGSSDPIAPVQLALLTGTSVPPQVCKLEGSSTNIDFGAQARETTTLRPITLHNAGSVECNLAAPAIDAAGQLVRFSVASPTQPTRIAPNGLLDLTVAYTPQDATGPDLGILGIGADDPALPGGQLRIGLKGTPTATPECRLEISPPKTATGRLMSFGVVGLGERKRLAMTLRNVGSKFCDIQAPRKGMLTESAFSFGTHVPALPGRINPGETQIVEVVFQPRTAAEFLAMTNTFTILTSDGQPSECTLGTGGGPGCKQVSMRGTGVTLAIDVVPSRLDFGVVTVGCNSADKTLTVYNIGGAAVTLNGFALDPPSSAFSIVTQPAVPLTLNPGRSATVVVRYRPQSSGLETATLVISHDFSGGTSTVPLQGTGSTATHQADQFQQNSVPKTDVLWVIDNSGSMSNKQQFLSQNAQDFISAANAMNCDYQVAVIATEWQGTNPPHQADSASAFPGQLIDAGGFFGNPKIIKRTDSDPALALSRNIRVGECCSDEAESGLEAAKAALSDPLVSDPAKPNSQFVRDDAKLAVIVLSDEEDQGGSQNVEYYVDFFQTLKGARNSTLFAWHSIVGDSSSGCDATVDGSQINAAAGDRYIEATTRTNGIFRSICTADWGRIANDIGLDAFTPKTQFFLSRTADPATLVITVNGARQTAGVDYDFDAASNSIVFRTGHVPAAGAAIGASYDTLCL